MLYKIKLALYYLIISKLPHSRLLSISNAIRKFYIAKVLKIMPYCKETIIEHDVYLSNGAGKVSIGEHCEINEHVFIQGATIGNFVMIAPHVAILNSTHHFSRIDIPMVKQGKGLNINPVIEDDVWLGRNVVIMPGVRIGKGSVVGAGAIVTRDVPPYSVVGGVPAKILRSRK